MNATKPSVDCDTGEVTWVELTDAEQAHRDALAAEEIPDPLIEDPEVLIAAEAARRAAFDEYMVGKTNSVANVLGATRAGSDAYLAVLQG